MGSVLTEDMVSTSFLEWIRRQEEDARLTNYTHYDNYYHGEHKLALPAKLKKALDDPLLSIVANYCSSVIDAATDYIIGGDPILGIDVSEFEMTTDNSRIAESYLNGVYDRSGLMGSDMISLVQEMCTKGDVFSKVFIIPDGDGNPVDIGISVIRPDVVFPKYADDYWKRMEYCAIKYFVMNQLNEQQWIAQVFYPNVVYEYDLGRQVEDLDKWTEDEEQNVTSIRGYHSMPLESHQWKFMQEVENPFGAIPVWHFKNGQHLMPYGVSDLQDVVDLQDALNKTFCDMLATMDYQAFQRIILFGASMQGEYDMGPGSIIEVPNESGRMMVIPAGSIADFLYTIDTCIDNISAVSRTPRQVFQGYNDVPTSGYALRIRYQQLEAKCGRKRIELRTKLQQMNRMILYTAAELGLIGLNESENKAFLEAAGRLSNKVHFTGGLPIDELMQAQVQGVKIANGTLSRYTAMEQNRVPNIEEEQQRIALEQGWIMEAEARQEEQSKQGD